MAAAFTFNGYDNFVLDNKIKSILTTKLDLSQFLTTDYSLTENEGMVKKIHRYSPSGVVQVLDRGDGNTEYITASFVEEEYRVKRTQGTTRYYDDDVMTDETLIDTQLRGLAEQMVNKFTSDAIAEMNKTSNQCVFTDWKLANFADAISKYAEVYETQEGLFFLASMDVKPAIQKALGDELKFVESYIKTGAVGAVLNVPIYFSKAVPSGCMFMATREAVTNFMKKSNFVEQDRDKQTKLNSVIAAVYNIVALTDETRCYKCGKAISVPTTITTATAGTTTVAGAAKTGASVKVYVNGELSGSATAASDSYSATVLENLVAGDVVKVVAHVDGYLESIATFTVVGG